MDCHLQKKGNYARCTYTLWKIITAIKKTRKANELEKNRFIVQEDKEYNIIIVAQQGTR